MNRIYRLVWHRAAGHWVAVSEVTRSVATGSARLRSARTRRGVLALSVIAAGIGATGSAHAAPAGAQVTAGAGTVTQAGNVTNVQQGSANLSLNWQSFNVAPNEVVNFVQPGAGSIAVNRILGNTGSEILGRLNANGQVWLINPNGVLFGPGAQVNVGGLAASTLGVDDAALGSNTRVFSGAGTGSVINRGTITAADGGYVALIGNQVSNQGVISARLGTVALGAGSAETLTFSGRQLINLQVDRSTLDNLAENRQLIQADGGRVVMTAGAQDALLASVVNNTGIVQARTVEDHHGTIRLLAGMEAGRVAVDGTLDASAPSGGTGGAITTSGAVVSLAATAKVVAGPGGSWLIDPTDLTIDTAAAAAIAASLQAGTSVTEETTATGASGPGVQTPGIGDITVGAAISWSNPAATLTLLAYNAIAVNAPIAGAGAVVMQASNGRLTIASGGSISGDAGVTLGTGAGFVNNAGATAVSAGASGRWLVYSATPAQDSAGGLTPGFIQYNAPFQAATAQAAGNGFLYSAAPTLAVTALTGPVSKTYDGGTAASLTGANYTVSGLLGADAVVAMSGTYLSPDAGTSVAVTSAATVAGLTVANAGIPVYGYALSGSPSTASIGTITPAPLAAAIVGDPTKVYNGTATAALTSANYGLTGFVAGQGATVNQPSSVAYGSANAGSQTVSATFAKTNFVAGPGTNLSNYVLPVSATGSGTIQQAPLQITGVLATNKVYDTTTADALDTTQAGLYGVIGADAVSLSTSGATGSFASPNAGSRLVVGSSGFALSGAAQANYRLIQPADLTANIARAPLSVSGVTTGNKVYDGSATAALNSSGAALSGIIGGDASTVVLAASSAVARYSTPNVGTGLAVTPTGYSVSGTNASNYVLAQPLGLTGNITPAALAVAVTGNPTKPYNGTTTAALSSSNFVLTGFVTGESATIPQAALAAYASVNAGTQPVTATLAKPDFAPGGSTLLSNYTLPTTATGTGTITKAPLSGMISNNPTKVYDGTSSAALSAGNYVLYGFLSGEGATVNQSVGAYASPNVGLQSVTAGLSQANYTANGGTSLSNYLLPTTLAGPGTIWPATVTGTIQAGIQNNPTKPYDGTTAATLAPANYVLTGFANGEGATVTRTVGQYASPNAGAQTVTATLVRPDFAANAGTNLANYTLPGTAYGTGTITAIPLTVGIVNDPTRVYNGSTTMVLAPSNYGISGFIAGEGAQINPSARIDYASANVGARTIAATLTPSAYTADGGTLMSNYVLATSATGVGHITPASLYVTGVVATSKVYDTTAADPLNSSAAALAGLVASDLGNVTLQGSAVGTFATVHAGTALPVSVTGYSIGGAAASNYTLQPVVAVAASITPAPLAVAGIAANAKPYDATDAATLNSASARLTGVLGADSVTLSTAQAVGTFASINVGNNLSVTASGFAVSGTAAGDYRLAQPSGLTANITPAPITALIIGNPTKVYDGSPSTTLTAANYSVLGFANGQGASIPQSATAAYLSPDAGVGVGIASRLVSSDFVATTGTNLSNYLLPAAGSGTGTITQAPITASIVGNPTKAYDGTAGAPLTAANYSLAGFVGSQSASLTQASGTYGSANAGSEPVTAALAAGDFSAGSGTNLNNYALPVAAAGRGTITPAALAVVGVTTSARVYDGTTIDALTGATLTGTFYNGDLPVLTNATTGVLGNNGNVGTDAVTTHIGLTGAGSGNYSIAQPTGLTAAISPATLAATSSVTRTYDGTNVASLSGANTTFTGFVAGQGATVKAGVTGVFASPNAGSGIAVTGGALALGDLRATGVTLLSNYTLPTSDNGSGTINAARLTYTATPSSQVYGTTPTGLSGSVGGFVNGETLATATTGTPAFTTAATGASNIGRYAINGSGLFANNGNYTFSQAVANATALTITPAPLTVVGVATTPRVYDGTTIDALTGATLTGTFYNGDQPVLTNFTTGVLGNSGNVGTDSVTTGFGLSGAGSGNYTVAQSTGLTAVISAAGLVATSSATRSYDGTAVAQLGGANTVLSGFIAGQGATVKAGVTGTFASADAGSGIAISRGALAASDLTANAGTQLSNYTLPTSDNGTGTITKAVVSLSGTRVYDALTDADASIFAIGGLVAGQNLTLSGSGTLGSKNVATNGALASLGSLALGDGTGLASNYTLAGGTDTATVTRRAITVTGTGTDKVYNGSVADAVTLAGTGVLSGDSLTFANTAATFADRNVGTGKTVSISGITAGGADAGNYTVNGTTTTTASITPAVVNLSGTRVYDANVDANAVAFGTAGTVAGISGENLVLSGGGTLVGKTVGSQALSSRGTLALGNGTGLASNYTLIGGTASINVTKLGITVAGTANNKVYDRTTGATVATLGSSGVLAGDTVVFANTSASFGTTGAANGKPVNIVGISASGADAGNYLLNNVTAATTANVTQKVITVTGTGSNKVYDGLLADTVALASSGVIAGDVVTFANTSATFADKNVGAAKTVTISGITKSGGASANYALAGTTATTSANITAAVVNLSGTRVYDAATDANAVVFGAAGTVAGVAGENLVVSGSGVLGGKNVVTNGALSSLGTLALNDGTGVAGNYTLSGGTDTVTVTKLGITVAGTGIDKVYNGNAVDAVTLASTGVLPGDSLAFANTSATFADKNVGTGKTVSISGITASGTDVGNYTVNPTATTTASITPLAITVTGTGTNRVYDAGVADAVTLSSTGKIVADNLNFTSTSAVFADKNAGNGKTVTISGIGKSGTDAGNYTLNNATATASANITPLAITVGGTGTDKVYDGNAADAVTLASTGVRPGDSLTFANTSATFANRNVGSGKAVTISGITASGTDVGNYTLNNATATTSANITPLAITVTGTGTDRVYDGGVVDAVTLASAGVLPVDALTFNRTSASFADKNVGTGKTVSISGITAGGTGASNYTVNSAATTTASITPLGITVTGTGIDRVYDGGVADTVALTSAGKLAGDNLTFAAASALFADKNVGAGKTVTISGIGKSGTDAANYTLNNASTTTTATITPRAITVTGTGTSREYDGGVADAVTLASTGVVPGDALTFGNASAGFANKNVGNGKAVSIAGITASGTDSANYTVNASAATTANVTPRAITVTGVGTDKVYDGGVADTVTLASAGKVAGDSLTFANTSAAFADKNVANGKTVTISGITAGGTDVANYTLNNATATTTANITPLAITVAATGTDRVYDGGVDDAVTLAAAGKLVGDSLTFGRTTAVFGDKNVANGKTVTISGITASGTDAGNYTLGNTTATTTANVTPLGITVVGTGTNRVYDGGVADAVTLASTGVLSGDSLTFGSTSASFADKNVGNAKAVSIAGITAGGTDSGNYTVNTTATTSANIAPLAITVTGVGTDKVYDGGVDDLVTLAGAGQLAGDNLTFANTSAVFADKNVGTARTVTISGITTGGADAANYALNNVSTTTTASITPFGITVTGTGTDKIYDGNVADAVILSGIGVRSGDALTLSSTSASFADKNVGTGKAVSISGILAGGADAGNYTVANATATTTANITPRAITVTGVGTDRVYDGGLVDAVTLVSAGKVTGDDLSFANGSATFADKNVADGKTVTISGITRYGTDAANYTLSNATATTTASITPLAIRVAATGTDKVYDGNAADAVTLAGIGVLAEDSLTFGKASANFADRNVGTGKTVTIVGIAKGGTDAGNYTLTNDGATTTADITPLGLTVVGTGIDKVYNGNAIGAVTLGSTGVLAGDSLTFDNASAAFADKNVGTGKAVSISGITASGTGAGNYTVNATAATTANITPLGITVTGTGTNKVYDGGVDDAVTLASGGVIAGDSVSFAHAGAVFGDKNVANGKTVTISGIGKSGADAANYALNNASATTTANITPLGITVAGTGTDKVYDGGLADSVTLAGIGVLSGDSLTFSSASADFADKNVGTAKAVSISGITANGPDAGNYAVANATATTTATITPLGIVVAATGVDKVYDGNVAGTVVLASAGVVAGDSLAFSSTPAEFANKNVGTGKTVSVSGISASGEDAANYTLRNATATTAANITPLAINVTAIGTDRVYDGGVADAVTLASTGVLSGDSLTFDKASASFADKNVGTGKPVSISGITASGTGSGNYTVNTSATTSANVTPLAITVTGTGTDRVYDGGTADAVTLASNGVLAGDALTFGNASARFEDKNVGTGKAVSISGITAGGADVGNYTVNATATASANVAPLAITVTGTGTNRVYDGGVDDAVTLASSGVIAGDRLAFGHSTAVFGDKNVGTGKTVTVTGITASGSDAGNYTLNNPSTATTANITPFAITVTGTGTDKVYDGNVADVVTLSGIGVLSGDSLTLSSTSARFADKNVGIGKAVSISGIAASGVDAGNYTVTNANATATATITPLGIVVAATGTDKVYDGNVADAVVLASAGVLAGDSLALSSASASFANRNVGTGKTVSISGIAASGTDAANYALQNATATTTAAITPLAIVVTGTGTDRVYDGGVADAVTLASTGVLPGDALSFDHASAAFADRNVGAGKAVSISGITATGAGAGNYTVNTSTTASATIAPLGITVGATGTDKVYDGGVGDTVTLASGGLVAGDRLTFGNATAVFADKNVANGKAVTVSGITIGGTDAGNYALNNVDATTTASITPRRIAVGATGTGKVYDGGVAGTATVAATGVLPGDRATLTGGSAAFDDGNVGVGKVLVVSGIGIGGGDASNYALTGVPVRTSADITPATLTQTASPTTIVSGPLPVLTGAVAGLVGGDTLANATTGTLVWTADAPASPSPGSYAINGSGLAAMNYVIVQSPSNFDALSVTASVAASAAAPAALVQSVFGPIVFQIDRHGVSTPYGIGSESDYGNNTGNARRDPDPNASNQRLTDFTGRVAITVIGAGVRLPPGVAP